MALKITDLVALAAADPADLLVIVDDVAGTPTTKKITVANLLGTFTDTRVAFASATGVLTDDADFTFDGSRLSLAVQGATGGLLVGGDARLFRYDAGALEEYHTGTARHVIRTTTETVGGIPILTFATGSAGSNLASTNILAHIYGIITQADPSVLIADLVFETNAGDSATERMRLTGAGNLGLGTTNPASIAGLNAGNGIQVVIGGPSGGFYAKAGNSGGQAARFGFVDNDDDSVQWEWMMSGANSNRLDLRTTNGDGAGTDADVIRIPQGQLTIDGNSTFDDNAFDYVCETCGKNSEAPFECHGKQAPWHDDVALMDRMVHEMKTNKKVVREMERLGLVNTYGTLDSEKPELFVSMNRMPWFLMSALAQMGRKVAALEARLSAS